MDIKPGELRAILTGKLGFTQSEGSKHELFDLYVDGVYVANTRLSRAKDPIRSTLFGIIARQVGVSSPQLRQIVACSIDRDGYLEIVGRR